MKKLLLFSTLLIGLSVSAQFSFGYHGMHNLKTPFNNGWGLGMDGLSAPLTAISGMETFPVRFHIGGGYSYLGCGNKIFKDVILDDGASPVDISFTNMQFTIQGTMRATVPSPNGKYIPYAEFSPGIRLANSTVNICGENDDNSSTYTSGSATGFNFSSATGLQVKLSETFMLDAGVAWNRASNPGTMIAIETANVDDGISYAMTAAPSSVVTFRFGIRVILSKKGCCSYEGCQVPQHHKTCGHMHVTQ